MLKHSRYRAKLMSPTGAHTVSGSSEPAGQSPIVEMATRTRRALISSIRFPFNSSTPTSTAFWNRGRVTAGILWTGACFTWNTLFSLRGGVIDAPYVSAIAHSNPAGRRKTSSHGTRNLSATPSSWTHRVELTSTNFMPDYLPRRAAFWETKPFLSNTTAAGAVRTGWDMR